MYSKVSATGRSGVAIGSTCDIASPLASFVIGILAGALSTFGFAILQTKIEKLLKGIDTCGVMNLHGLPGLLGGISAIFITKGIDTGSQLTGIGITILVAIVSGFIVGKAVAVIGRKTKSYDDVDEFAM